MPLHDDDHRAEAHARTLRHLNGRLDLLETRVLEAEQELELCRADLATLRAEQAVLRRRIALMPTRPQLLAWGCAVLALSGLIGFVAP